MEADNPNAESLGSFRIPVPLINIDPDADPLVGVCFNASYLPYIAGALKQLLLQATWDTDDPNALWLQQERIMNLIGQFSEECPQMFAPGLITMNASSATPTGWLPCDGSAVSRSTYANLFAAIGTTFGAGDGSTTFNVPAFPGRTPIGIGTGSGLSPRAMGNQLGEETHTLTQAEMPAHSHSIDSFVPTAAGLEPTFASLDTGVPTSVTGNTGGGGSHNNMQPSLAVGFIIKT